ncbi:MAG: sodium-dependent transporter [Gammaproteobacteria bacterium]|nr:sodium-dependent transporter [Gammaproteobacteria bacterium]
MASRTSRHGFWSSRWAFILAVTGSAVGLGNIWKFPYIAGENGGGAFVLVYLLCVFAIGLPIMMSEILLGRRGRRNPITTMALIGEEEAGTPAWQYAGMIGVLAGALILSFYSVIAGWSLAYVFKMASGAFNNVSASGAGDIFNDLKADWEVLVAWHTAFMALTVGVVARGVERGLEAAVRILMPVLVLLLIGLAFYSADVGNFGAAAKFLFNFDFSRLTLEGVLIALGHAFFTLSIGMGAIMAYGAYLPAQTSIAKTSVAVVIADTFIALLAGMVIFPLVFGFDLDPGSGPGLIFQTLPIAFGQMPGGLIFGTLFFLLLTFAAWTSSISLMEPAVAWVIEKYDQTRSAAAFWIGLVIWYVGLGAVFSFNLWKDKTAWKGTVFDNLDHVASNLMLPIGGLVITLFAGWVMSPNATSLELNMASRTGYRVWRFAARYVAPIGVLFILLKSNGWLEVIEKALFGA